MAEWKGKIIVLARRFNRALQRVVRRFVTISSVLADLLHDLALFCSIKISKTNITV